MRVGIMVTNNGSHPPEKWASESAAQLVDIIQLEPSAMGYHALVAEKARLAGKFEKALVPHFKKIQDREKDKLEEDGEARLKDDVVPNMDILDEAVESVLSTTADSMFSDHFEKAEVKKFVKSSIGSHMATVKDVERSWYTDQNS